MKLQCFALFFAAASVFGSAAHASLESRLNGQAVYDPTRNLTWLANANLLGQSSWTVAQEQIVILNSQNYLGFNDWRLPTTPLQDPACSSSDGTNGFGCTGSEMGHLFYEELGGSAGSSILNVSNSQLTLFTDVQPGYYWSSTLSPIFPGPFTFVFGSGAQDASNNYDSPYYSWLVRSGDVNAVPVPASALLFASGLLALGVRMTRKASVLGKGDT